MVAAALFGAASVLCAAGLGELDSHLSVVPRSEAEVARIAKVTALAHQFQQPEAYETLPGGAASFTGALDRTAFTHASPSLAPQARFQFELGKALFEKLWVAAPSSTRASDGLGPLYNARSCGQCHRREGRAHPPAPGEAHLGFVLKFFPPDPVYGRQLQDLAVLGQAPEGQFDIIYDSISVALADGETVTLRKPRYELRDLAYGPLANGTQISPRVAPQMIGLGLIEAIPAADILALADPSDRDGDGISGRAHMVWSAEYGQDMLGRFGLKADEPTVASQSAAAFATDIGISTPLHPAHAGDCTAAQPDCLGAPHGNDQEREGLEIDSEAMAVLVHYARNLAVPARRDPAAKDVLRGKELFYEIGCPACHQPKFVTHRLSEAAGDQALDNQAQSFQLIWPYSDFLLHDMGDGLADAETDPQPDPGSDNLAREWRTPPLWGIGLTKLVTGRQSFLHDGRARNLLEAVLWHGGEAAAQRDQVAALPKPDRDALIRFLESL
ncbi:MAG: di-heme oxidoredictase family protein [Mangrovicoccus sp.]